MNSPLNRSGENFTDSIDNDTPDESRDWRPITEAGMRAANWLLAWEALGRQCSVIDGTPTSDGQRTFKLVDEPMDESLPSDATRIADLRRQLQDEGLELQVMMCLLYRGDMDELLGCKE